MRAALLALLLSPFIPYCVCEPTPPDEPTGKVIGEPCGSDSECLEGSCHLYTAGSFCSTPCESDAECSEETTCWQQWDGSRWCLPGDCEAASCAEVDALCGDWEAGCGEQIDCGACEVDTHVTTTDGVAIFTRLFLPRSGAAEGVPTLLYRTPYRDAVSGSYYDDHGRFHAGRGYALVHQDCRGTHDSEGFWDPFRREVEVADGADAVAWILEQPWSNGDVGTIGGSYEAFTAIAAAMDNPAVKVVIADGAAEGMGIWTQGGMVSPLSMLYQAVIDDISSAQTMALSDAASNALELATLDEELFGETVPVWQDMIAHPTLTDPFWDDRRLAGQLHRVCAPVLVTHSVGFLWDDPARVAQELFDAPCAEVRGQHRYFIGHFAHSGTITSFASGSSTVASDAVLGYIDRYLGGQQVDLDAVAPVTYAGTVGGPGRSAEVWPPSAEREEVLYAHFGTPFNPGALDGNPPTDEPPSEMAIDPEADNGCDYNTQLPMIYFLGPRLLAPLFVVGTPRLVLHASATALDADFVFYLMAHDSSESDPSAVYRYLGVARLRARYRDGLEATVPLTPDEPFEAELEFTPTSTEIPAGAQLMLYANASACSWIENPHTAEPLTAQTQWQTSTHRVLHETERATRLVLPIAPASTRSSTFSTAQSLPPQEWRAPDPMAMRRALPTQRFRPTFR